MKQLLFCILLLSISLGAIAKKKEEIKKYDENYRAQFHYSPEYNRMGNPISVWVNDSTYNLYYQYNPHNLLDGYINWGHATSTDLLKWEQKGIVIAQPITETDSMKMVPWSGAVCSREGKTYAWVNRWGDAIYFTSSTDGINWEKEEKTTGTEKLAKSEAQVFWHENSQKWVMIAFERDSTSTFILNSSDGLYWEETSKFNYTFGFPKLYELPVDRKIDDTRWVFATETGTYMLGDFDGKKFNVKTSIRRFNYSKSIGSTVFFKHTKSDKMLAVSNIKGEQLSDLPSRGQLTFPVEVFLHEFESGVELLQLPCAELEELHTKSYLWEEKKIYPGIKNNILSSLKGSELHFKGVIDVKNSDQFGFIIRTDKNQAESEIGFNAKRSTFNVLNTNIEYKPINNKIEFEILIDRSSVEVFLDGGRYVVSVPFSPSPEALKYELFTRGGEINVDKLEVHKLKSVWRED